MQSDIAQAAVTRLARRMEPVRIQKFLADSGLCSRRAAEALVAEGAVRVNGKPASTGQKLVPGADRVTVNGRPVRFAAPPSLTLALNKPRGVVCTNSDPHAATTVFDLLPPELRKIRLFCAGRLDKDSEGLVILTSDGALAHRLTHPSTQVVKRYDVRLAEPFAASRISSLLKGVTVEGEHLKVERAFLLGKRAGDSSTCLEVHLHHGKKREIRQLFLCLGCEVKRLRRFQIGLFTLKGIPLRGARVLSRKQIELLFASGADRDNVNTCEP